MSTDPYQLTVTGTIPTGPSHGTLVTATQPFSIKNVDPTILALMMKQPPAAYIPGSTPTAPFTSTGADGLARPVRIEQSWVARP